MAPSAAGARAKVLAGQARTALRWAQTEKSYVTSRYMINFRTRTNSGFWMNYPVFHPIWALEFAPARGGLVP